MQLRLSIVSLLAVVVSLLGFAAPASAVNRILDQGVCDARTDFTAFFRHHDVKDKYCYNNSGPDMLLLELDGITWFNAGANSGWFTFWDAADGQTKVHTFNKGDQTGCTQCRIEYLYLTK
ncbi:hypothetical protein [Lentzea sp. NEAU-D7]|uniref:hypothetical protein n=1 Tax=Lentzea sp. NEAU-D7 TaxID=2994667 RepID=UPI00224B9F2F|nr:hypothetical protein [Lentzea sp. NEAU-D7]MCX2954297.1 hypothetical protein [Lentzea sp. NEAU-D7]